MSIYLNKKDSLILHLKQQFEQIAGLQIHLLRLNLFLHLL